ncbi:MAG: hypothetical protein QOI78_5831, partial [Actinomycetota bacterium]|nr:hypothetical protein [Actinomycetota bacterium]
MKKFHPSPAFVISLIALFVALGGTSYAAITTLPANSVGTAQLKTGAVTGAKLSPTVLKYFLHYGGTLPSGKTEVGDWGTGNVSAGTDLAGSGARPVISFPVPLAHGLNGSHTIYVAGTSAVYCPGAGHAAPGYLCVYQDNVEGAATPNAGNIFNPEVVGGPPGTGKNGWSIYLHTTVTGDW